MQTHKALLLALACTAPAALAAGDGKVKIAVLDLQARGVDASLVQSAGTLIASEINKLEVFKVVSREDIRNMLSFEKDKQNLGCEADQACLAEIGGALGVEYIVAGSLAKIGDTLLLSMTLNNVKTANVEGRVSENITGKNDALIGAIARNSKVLVAKILKGREGYLVLTSAESGALVKIDGQIKGTTPMKGRLTLSWGPHLLEVEKTGFITYSEDINIPNKQALAKSVGLVPSNDFIDGYEGTARKMRLGAWITTGLAVAGGATALALNQVAGSTETKFAAAKTSYLQTLDQSKYDEMKSLSSKGNNQVLGARIALGAGVVALGLATYFWVAGNDPRRYEGFREAGEPARPSASGEKPSSTSGDKPGAALAEKRGATGDEVLRSLALAAAPLPGGAGLGVAGRF